MKIGPYEVLGELGRGGMGVVYRVRLPDGRGAAMKYLARTDAETFARFERERRLLDSLGEAEGFVGLLDAGSEGGAAWLVMPLVPGGTLRKRLAAGPLAVDETVALGVQLATALGKAHDRGIVHRDVKPENVLFDAKGRPLLGDLGLAKHFDRSAPGASQSLSLTDPGSLVGTAGYMAPEQINGAADVGPPADVFALGAILYECLAGTRAFPGTTPVNVLASVAKGTPPPIDRDDVSASLEAAVRKALAADPRARFPDGTSFARALEGGASRQARGRARAIAGVAAAALLVLGGLAVGLERSLTKKRALALVVLSEQARGAGDLDGAVARATEAIELDPSLARAWSERGIARAAKGGKVAALGDLGQAIELEPGSAEPWQNRASVRWSLDDREGAMADVTRAIELAPAFALAWRTRAAMDVARKDAGRAIADATRAIELDPRLALAWLDRAEGRQLQGDLDGTIADATGAIELDPKLAKAWAIRAFMRLKRNELDGASSDATRAVELDPRILTGWVVRGAVRLSRGDWDGVIADETRVIALEPEHSDAWDLRAHARLSNGDLDGAIADETRSVELDPERASAWYIRGVAHANKEEPGTAIADLTKAIEVDPKLANAYYSRGVLRIQEEDIEGGVADLERYLALAPEAPNADEVRETIRESKERR